MIDTNSVMLHHIMGVGLAFTCRMGSYEHLHCVYIYVKHTFCDKYDIQVCRASYVQIILSYFKHAMYHHSLLKAPSSIYNKYNKSILLPQSRPNTPSQSPEPLRNSMPPIIQGENYNTSKRNKLPNNCNSNPSRKERLVKDPVAV